MDVDTAGEAACGRSVHLLVTDGESLASADEKYVTVSVVPVALPDASPIRLYAHSWRQAPLTALCMGRGRPGAL
jgi:hypothetical protein